MGKIAFEDQAPGDVKYGSFSVDELEAMGLGSLHSNVESLQEVRKAFKQVRLYSQMLNIWAVEIEQKRTEHSEYELCIVVPTLRVAADYLRTMEELGPIPNIAGCQTVRMTIWRLKDYLEVLRDNPEMAKPEQVERIAMVVRFLQSS